MTFNPLVYPICLETPFRLKLPNWQGHIPFGMLLIAALRPKVLVELGTHFGDSYCAFCQAVKALDSGTRCYAVDTWQGDEHSGYYGPEVLMDLRAYHDPIYADFSTLMQMSFDEATPEFNDESINILHIDGLHTYEAVRHDFETWLPKVADSGVILIHDISVYQPGFGVWKLWEEIADRWPHFSFLHSSGLGVAFPRGVPTTLCSLVGAQGDEVAAIRRFFATVGGAVAQLALQGSPPLDPAATAASDKVAALGQRLAALERHNGAITDSFHANVANYGQRLDNLDHHLGNLVGSVNTSFAHTTERLDALEASLIGIDGYLVAARGLADLVAEHNRRLNELEGGLSNLAVDSHRQGEELKRLLGAQDQRLNDVELSSGAVRQDIDEVAVSLGDLLRLRDEMAGPRELVRLMIDAQHRLGVPFTISGVTHRIRVIDQAVKRLGRLRVGSPPVQVADAARKTDQPHLPGDNGHVIARCDHPVLETTMQVGAKLRVEGWAVSPSGILEVRALIDGIDVGTIPYGQLRPDVDSSVRLPGADKSGFRGYVDLAAVPPGRHELRLRLQTGDGASTDLVGTINLDHSFVETRIQVPDFDDQYQAWLRTHELSENQLRALRGASARLAYRPLISILVPVYNTPVEYLTKAIDSVQRQVYDNWELCLWDDASSEPHIRSQLEERARSDRRIRVGFGQQNVGIAEATNAALGMARGEFVGLLDHDDVLWPNALYECAKLLNQHPDADMIYSDEDKIDLEERHYSAFFKPDWSPDLLFSMMYTGHFSVYRRDLIVTVGGFRREYSGSQDHDLALRVTERTNAVHHIPTVLYSWRSIPGSAASNSDAKPYAVDAARRALQDAVARREVDATVERGFAPGFWRVRYSVGDDLSPTLLMPTGGNVRTLEPALQSILERSSHQNFRLVIVDNSEGRAIEDLVHSFQDSRLSRIEYRAKPFNYSSIMNHAVRQVKGEYLVFLNDDLTVRDQDWITSLLEHARRPEVGVVGTKLLYPDGAVQHAGVVMGLFDNCGHIFKRYPPDHPGPFGMIEVIRNVSAVTFACAMTRRSVFEEVGGLDEENLRIAFNDVDYCLRAGQRGYRVIYTPYAAMYHHESASRGVLPGVTPGEVELMQAVWSDRIRHDPFYNPNLTRRSEDNGISAQN